MLRRRRAAAPEAGLGNLFLNTYKSKTETEKQNKPQQQQQQKHPSSTKGDQSSELEGALPPLRPVWVKNKIKHIQKQGAGIAQWLEHRTRD